jgi:hypothetical protein
MEGKAMTEHNNFSWQQYREWRGEKRFVALGMTPQQIDEMQREAMKIASELKPDTVIGKLRGA